MASSENLPPTVLASLARQVKALAAKPPDGIKYIPTDGSLSEIHAEIAGPEDTPFYGGSFRLKLVFGSDYPSAPPKGYFLTRIFHPNVSSSGDICVNTLKRDWSAELGIGHVLQVIRCLLIVPFPQSSLNEEAGKLFMENYEDYRKHARLMTSIHASSSDVAAPTDASTPAASKSSLAEKKVKTKKAQKKGLKRL